MPTDLFQQQGINAGGNTPPVDLFQQAGVNPTSQQQPSLLNRFVNAEGQGAADVLSGLTKAGIGLANTPHNLVNLISPSAASHIPTSPLTNVDVNQLFGNPNPGTYGKFLEGSAQYLPAAAVPAESLPALTAVGAGYGATQDPNPIFGATGGALTNLTLGAGGKLISEAAPHVWNGIKDFFSKYAAQGISKNVGNSLDAAKSINNVQAFNLAKQNFDALSNQEKGAWNNLSTIAQQVDAQGVPFNNKSYTNSLKNQLTKLTDQSSRQSGYARANADSVNLLNDYLQDQHNTFTGAIEHNKALNQDYQNEITPGKSLPFNTINFAKGNLKNAINQNIATNELDNSLGSAWNDANAITAQKNNIFNQVANNKGQDKLSTFASIINGKSQISDPTTFINDYLPTNRGDGIQKMQQFAHMVGDESTAKNAIKQNYFDKALTNDGIDPKAFLNKYNNLSTEQQHYLFNPQENQSIQALNSIAENHPDVFSKSMMSSLSHHSISATLGGILGLSTGHGLWEGLGAGLVGGALAKAGLQKLFEKPAISNYFVKQLTAPTAAQVSPNIAGNVNRYIAPAITPHVVNYFGAQ